MPNGTGTVRPARATIRAHAKINLSLRVVGSRPDGYHELETVFQSLWLHDLIAFEAHDALFSLSCSDPAVPADERNLVWKAAALLWECAGFAGAPRGVQARIVKRVPAQGGLGGGSADGAATLRALDALWRTRVGEDRLDMLARSLGADVPFFLCGGSALGVGRGDVLRPQDDLDRADVLLVFPPFGVSTPEAFSWFDQDGAGAAGTEGNVGRSSASSGVGRSSAPSGVGRSSVFASIRNDLQPPVSRRHPEIELICSRLRSLGAEAASMTGSGSTVFGLFGRREAAVAAAGVLESEGWRTLVTRTAGRHEAQGGLRLRPGWTSSARIV